MRTRKSGIRRVATVMAAVGALLASSGIALMTVPTSASAEDCVPADAYTETTEWVEASPGEGWVQVDSRIKTEATEGQWVDLVWHNYNGNLDGTPALDDPNWHAVPGGPPQGQESQHAVPPRVPNEPYNVSDENGRGSWFLYTGTWVPGQDAVYEYLFSFDHPAVTCEVVEPPVVEPPVVEPPVVEPPAEEPVTETVTPTVVHAGVTGEAASSSTTAGGLGLIATGLVVLAAAGALVLRKGDLAS